MQHRISLVGICILTMLMGCEGDSGANPEQGEPFSLTFMETGGYAGVHNVLAIMMNDSVFYTSANLQVGEKLEEQDIQVTYSILETHGFFAFDSTYIPSKPIADDIIYTLQYESTTRTKQVVASGSCTGMYSECSWPIGLHTIIDSLRQFIVRLREETTSGCVKIQKQFILQEWPFGSELALSEHISETIEIRDTIYQHIWTNTEQDTPVRYFEDGWIYRMNVSIRFNTPTDDIDTTLTVHDRTQPIYWILTPPLHSLPPTGIVVMDTDYSWLKEAFNATHYPWYFLDDSLAHNIPAYELQLVHGNACR